MSEIEVKKSALLEKIVKARYFTYQPFDFSQASQKTVILKLDGVIIQLEENDAKIALDEMKEELRKQENEQF